MVGYIQSVIPEQVKQTWRQVKAGVKGASGGTAVGDDADGGEGGKAVKVTVIGEPGEQEGFAGTDGGVVDHGYAEAEKANESENASM